LSQHSEAAAAAAELEALESQSQDAKSSLSNIPVSDKNELVKQYVEKLSTSSVHVKEEPHSNIMCPDVPRDGLQFTPSFSCVPAKPVPNPDLDDSSHECESLHQATILNPNAKPFVAKYTSTPKGDCNNNVVVANELTRFLMKKRPTVVAFHYV
jgi:hypothetical protein